VTVIDWLLDSDRSVRWQVMRPEISRWLVWRGSPYPAGTFRFGTASTNPST